MSFLMLLSDTKNKPLTLILNKSAAGLFLLFFSFSTISCNKKNIEANEYSDAFKPVFNKTSHYFDFNLPARGMYYLDSAFVHITKPNLNDRFRYYAFHY